MSEPARILAITFSFPCSRQTKTRGCDSIWEAKEQKLPSCITNAGSVNISGRSCSSVSCASPNPYKVGQVWVSFMAPFSCDLPLCPSPLTHDELNGRMSRPCDGASRYSDPMERDDTAQRLISPTNQVYADAPTPRYWEKDWFDIPGL